MADNNQSKGKSKTSENLLMLLGSLGTIAGPLIFGPDWNVDIGMPFKLGSAMLQQHRKDKELADVLNSNPYTQDLVPEIESTIQSGGLMGVLQGMTPSGGLQAPTFQAPPPAQPSLSQGSNLMEGLPQEPSIAPIAPQVSPSIPTGVAPSPTSGLNLQSDEFLKILAAKRPDLAEKVLVSRATQKEANPLLDYLNLSIKMNQLEAFETPEQKQQRKLEYAQVINEMYKERAMESKQEASRLQREKWTASESKSIVDYDVAIANSRFLLDRSRTGINQNMLSAIVSKSPVSARAASSLSVVELEQVQEYRDILKMVMTAVRTQSGVQYGFRELQWIKSSQPSEWDSPEMFQKGVTMSLNTQLWNKYGIIIRKAERAKNADVALREGMTPEQIKAWKILDKQLEKRAISSDTELNIFADPQNMKLLQTLNMGMI